MRYLLTYRLWESLENPLGIQEFVERIGIDPDLRERVIQWWQENRSGIRIHYFNFNSSQPIMGVFLGEADVAINSRVNAPGWMKLFLALHESRHADQHREGDFMQGYWQTVIAEEEEEFLEAYQYFERDANDFAVGSMLEMGFRQEMEQEGTRLRGNERAGRMVYQMMRRDIQRFQPDDFIDLLKIQIL